MKIDFKIIQRFFYLNNQGDYIFRNRFIWPSFSISILIEFSKRSYFNFNPSIACMDLLLVIIIGKYKKLGKRYDDIVKQTKSKLDFCHGHG